MHPRFFCPDPTVGAEKENYGHYGTQDHLYGQEDYGHHSQENGYYRQKDGIHHEKDRGHYEKSNHQEKQQNQAESTCLHQREHKRPAKPAGCHPEENQGTAATAQRQQGRREETTERPDGHQLGNHHPQEIDRHHPERHPAYRRQHRTAADAAEHPGGTTERPQTEICEVDALHGASPHHSRPADVYLQCRQPVADVPPHAFRARICLVPEGSG